MFYQYEDLLWFGLKESAFVLLPNQVYGQNCEVACYSDVIADRNGVLALILLLIFLRGLLLLLLLFYCC